MTPSKISSKRMPRTVEAQVEKKNPSVDGQKFFEQLIKQNQQMKQEPAKIEQEPAKPEQAPAKTE